MSLSRRRFLAASASLPFGLQITSHTALGKQTTEPKIGDPKETFDAWFGPGTEAGEFVSYPPLAAGRASYHVAFDEELRARLIVGDFNQLAGGGIEFNENDIGQSQYIPADAVAGTVFLLGGLSGGYGLGSWHSPTIAAATGGSGHIVVLDRFERESYILAHFKETTITLETPDVNPVHPTGEHLGPHSSEAEWEAYPGGVSYHQMGFQIVNPPVSGSWNIHSSGDRGMEILITPDTNLSTQDASQLVGSMLPAAELTWTTMIEATPITNTQIRLHQFRALNTGAEYLTIQFVTGDEETGTVTQLHLKSAPM